MKNYIKQYQKLHHEDESFGTSGILVSDKLMSCIDYLKPKTILDFGCGKGILIDIIKKKFPDIEVFGYDPAVEKYKNLMGGGKADLVINTDVLEHIPEEDVLSVIEQISRISQNVFFQLHHYPAVTYLPNGQNAHCTIKPLAWYLERIGKYFPKMLVFPGVTNLQTTVITFEIPCKLCETFLSSNNKLLDSKEFYEFQLKIYQRYCFIMKTYYKFRKKLSFNKQKHQYFKYKEKLYKTEIKNIAFN